MISASISTTQNTTGTGWADGHMLAATGLAIVISWVIVCAINAAVRRRARR